MSHFLKKTKENVYLHLKAKKEVRVNEYICFWVDKCNQINSWESEKKYVLSELCFPLSSKYDVYAEKNSPNQVKITIKENNSVPANYLGKNLVDIKAFVGENGVGKTTVMQKLFQLITSGNALTDIGCDFVLVYKNGNKYSYKTSLPNVSVTVNESTLECTNDDAYKAEWTLWYASAFYDHEQISMQYKGSVNLQSNGLFWSDYEFLNNHSSSLYDLYTKKDSLSFFYAMEQNRFVEFILDGAEYFSGLCRLPDTIIIELSEVNLDNALVEWCAHRYDETDEAEEDVNEWLKSSIDSPLPTELAKKRERRDSIESEKNDWKRYYNQLSFNDKLRFSALLSFCRTHNAYVSKDIFAIKNNFTDLWENAIKRMTLTDAPENDLFIKHVEDQFTQLKKYVEEIVTCLKENSIKNDGRLWFNLKKDEKSLKKIKQSYDKIFKLTPFLDFKFNRPLSSGEHSFLKLYYRLYHAFKNSTQNERSNNITLFIDEADLFLHPSWQREWLSYFIDGMIHLEEMLKNNVDNNKQCLIDRNENLNVQLFISTHSPFMISELMNEHVVFMNHKENNPMNPTEIVDYKIDNISANIFGANMFDILGGGFFLNGTIGKYAEQKIIDIVNKKRRNENLDPNDILLIEKIGDPIIRSLLENVEEDNVSN